MSRILTGRSLSSAQSRRDDHKTALIVTETIATTIPVIQPAMCCEVRIAPSATPMPTTPPVAIVRTNADSSGGRSRRSGSIEAPAAASPSVTCSLRSVFFALLTMCLAHWPVFPALPALRTGTLSLPHEFVTDLRGLGARLACRRAELLLHPALECLSSASRLLHNVSFDALARCQYSLPRSTLAQSRTVQNRTERPATESPGEAARVELSAWRTQSRFSAPEHDRPAQES